MTHSVAKKRLRPLVSCPIRNKFNIRSLRNWDIVKLHSSLIRFRISFAIKSLSVGPFDINIAIQTTVLNTLTIKIKLICSKRIMTGI